MRAMLALSGRNRRELMRDPLSLIFGVALPLVLLVLMSLIGRSIPAEANPFAIERFAPGMAVFSLTFLMLFAGMLLAADRASAFLSRTFASPLSPGDYIAAYIMPLIPLGLAQGAICLAAALCFGLTPTWRLLWAEAALLPAILLFIAFGMLFGVLCSDKQVGAVSSIVIQVASLLGGIWFDLDLLGGGFGYFARCLPFAHAVSAVQKAIAGELQGLWINIVVTLGWTVAILVIAIFLFSHRMRRGE